MQIGPDLIRIAAQVLSGIRQNDALELRVGQIVRASLLEWIGDKEATFSIEGVPVRASVESVDVRAGTTIRLLVEGKTDDGALKLKLLPKELNSESLLQSTDRLMLSLRLPDRPFIRQVISDMLLRNLPVDRDSVLKMTSLIEQQQPASTEESQQLVSTLARMESLQIPLQKGALEAMKALWYGPKLHDNIAVLERSLTAASEGAFAENSTPRATVPLAHPGMATTDLLDSSQEATLEGRSQESDLTSHNQTRLADDTASETDTPHSDRKGIMQPEGQSKPSVMAAVVKLASALQDSEPSDSSAQLSSVSRSLSQTIQSITVNMDAFEQLPTVEKSEKLQMAVQRLGITYEHDIAQMLKNDLNIDQTSNRTMQTLKHDLLSITSNDLSAGTPLTGEAGKAADSILSQLTAQQLLHSTKTDAGPFFYHFFALPTKLGGQKSTAEVHVLTRRKKGKSLDPFNCYLYFALDLPRLGELGIHVQVVERVLSVRFLTHDRSKVALAEKDVSGLRSVLEKTGYRLGNVKVEEKSHTDLRQPILPIQISTNGLDFRV